MYAIFLFISSSLALAQGREIIFEDSTRIMNGNNAQIGEFPFQVSLQAGAVHFCGGCILSANYILTAGHCLAEIQKNPEKINIIAGTVNKTEPHTKHKVVGFKLHEQYDAKALINDIGMIQIEPAFEFSDLIAPVELPKPHEVVCTNATVTVSGWGRPKMETPISDEILQKVNVFVTDQDYCSLAMKEVNKVVLKTNICAQDFHERKGQCYGDSGGPLTIKRKLIGIVSFSHYNPTDNCTSPKYPGVYTRVTEFIDWIVENATL